MVLSGHTGVNKLQLLIERLCGDAGSLEWHRSQCHSECQWDFQGQQVRKGVSDCPNWSRVDQGQWQKNTPGGLTFDYTFIVTLFVNGKQPLMSSLRYKYISGQLTCGDKVVFFCTHICLLLYTSIYTNRLSLVKFLLVISQWTLLAGGKYSKRPGAHFHVGIYLQTSLQQ